MTPDLATLEAFHTITRGATLNGPALQVMWKQAQALAHTADPLDHLTADQRAAAEAAWRAWQAEESRDGGYDHNLCQKLRRDYYRLLADFAEGEAA